MTARRPSRVASWSAWPAASSCDQPRRSRSYTRRSLGGQRRCPAIAWLPPWLRRIACIVRRLHDKHPSCPHSRQAGDVRVAQYRRKQPEQATWVLPETHLDAVVAGPPGWFPGIPSMTTVTAATKREVAPADRQHHPAAPERPLNSHEERHLVMRHAASGGPVLGCWRRPQRSDPLLARVGQRGFARRVVGTS